MAPFWFIAGEGLSLEIGEVNTDKGYAQLYHTYGPAWGIGASLEFGGGAIFPTGNIMPTLSDWSGYAGTISFGKVYGSISAGKSLSYYTIGASVGHSYHYKLKPSSSVAGSVGKTTLIGHPNKRRDYSGFTGSCLLRNGKN